MISQSILVTGATGFIGRHVVDRLIAQDSSVVLSVREIARCPRRWLQSERIRIAETVGRTPAELFDEPGRIDTVVHLAGLAHVGETAVGADAFESANVELTAQLAGAALRSGTRRFINLSSIAAVTSEARGSVVSDITPAVPQTAYGRTKLAAEAHVEALAEHGVLAVSLRPPLVVGADAKGNWAQLQALAATGVPLPFASVRNRRGLIGVEALAEIIVCLCETEPQSARSGAYAVAHPEALSLPEMLTLLRRGMGRPARLFPVPPGVLRLGRWVGFRRQVESLIGDFRIDASRFFAAFPDCLPGSIREEIEKSGLGYTRLERPER